MAKGLRSQSKKKYKAIKRQTVFKPVEDQRLSRLAAAQLEAASKGKVGDFMDEDKDTSVEHDNDNKMDTREANKNPAKISTSGARSAKQAKRLSRKKKLGKKRKF